MNPHLQARVQLRVGTAGIGLPDQTLHGCLERSIAGEARKDGQTPEDAHARGCFERSRERRKIGDGWALEQAGGNLDCNPNCTFDAEVKDRARTVPGNVILCIMSRSGNPRKIPNGSSNAYLWRRKLVNILRAGTLWPRIGLLFAGTSVLLGQQILESGKPALFSWMNWNCPTTCVGAVSGSAFKIEAPDGARQLEISIRVIGKQPPGASATLGLAGKFGANPDFFANNSDFTVSPSTKKVLVRDGSATGLKTGAYFFRLLSRICGLIPVPGVVPSCDTGQFPWPCRCESRRIVW